MTQIRCYISILNSYVIINSTTEQNTIFVLYYMILMIYTVSFITLMSTAANTDVLADAAFCTIQLLYLWH